MGVDNYVYQFTYDKKALRLYITEYLFLRVLQDLQ